MVGDRGYVVQVIIQGAPGNSQSPGATSLIKAPCKLLQVYARKESEIDMDMLLDSILATWI